MSATPGKVFSLAEANELVPRVVDLTSEVMEHLDSIRQQYDLSSAQAEAQMPETVLKEVEDALTGWSEQIVQMGAFPKGYFTVDFQSLDPELLYCWTYGEERIKFTHKVWENFAHRRPLADAPDGPSAHLKWIN
jgi:hypothetical protein